MDTIVRGKPIGQTRPVDVTVRYGRVVSVRPAGRGAADVGSAEAWIAPPLLDMQVNGIGSVDLQGPDLTPDKVRAATDLLALHGVGYWMPTLITGPSERMEHGCRMIAEAMGDPVVARAVAGIHLEGPYISPVDGPRGAHALEYVRPPSLREFARLQRAAHGLIRCVTVAPEVEGAIRFIRILARRGVLVALGHHHATAGHIRRAADAGARLSTHLGNGLASTVHRHQNPIWPQLAEDRLAASLIADLHHLPADVLKTFIRAKGPGRIVLVSDCVHIAGLVPGRYSLGGQAVELLATGRICLSGTGFLAGSSLLLWQGVANAIQAANLSPAQAVACATEVPAHVLGLPYRFRPPVAGRKAHFVVVNMAQGADLSPRRTGLDSALQAVFIEGRRLR